MSGAERLAAESEPRLKQAGRHWWVLLPAALVLGFCVLLFVRDREFFWVADYQLWFAPMFEDVTRAWRGGEWPILTQETWAAGNLAGEYQCGTFSLIFNAVLCAVWNLPLTIPSKAAALSTVHLMFLATGVYLLARKRGLDTAGATFASVIASLNGWLMVWAATDWFGALAGFSWVPWLWWSFLGMRDPETKFRRWVLPALFVYLLIAAGNPYAVVMGTLVALREVFALSFRRQWRDVGAVIFAGLLGIGLSAPAWMALLEMVQGSQRGNWGNVLHDSWKVPWSAWLGLALPAITTQWCDFFVLWRSHICVEMGGGLIPLGAVVAAATGTRGGFLRKHAGDFVFLAVIVALASAPGFGSFRWSFRLLPVFFLVLGLIGAEALRATTARAIAITCGILILAAGGIAFANGALAEGHATEIQIAIVLSWIALTFTRADQGKTWMTSGTALALLFTGFTMLPTSQKVSRHKFTENLRSVAPLDPDRLYLSVHNFNDIIDEVAAKPGFGSVLRPCNTPLLSGVHFINGYTSFTPPGVSFFFQTHGSLEQDKEELFLSPQSERLLDLLGVDGLVVARKAVPLMPSIAHEWQIAYVAEEGNVYHHWPRRATGCKALDAVFDRPGLEFNQPELHVVSAGRQTVRVEVRNKAESDVARQYPIALAFPRPWFPGYEATLNGKPVPVRAYLDFIPLVELPGGSSGVVELRYWPRFLRVGLPVVGASAGILLGICGVMRAGRRFAAASRD